MSGHILIIDAVPTNRIVLKVKMNAAQYMVTCCADAAQAEALIRKSPPDLVLINLGDEGGDGYALCRNLRANPLTENIAIVSVGGSDTSRDRFAALDAGADDVLPRPISDALLLARIRSLLRRRNLGQELMMRDGTNRALGFEEEAGIRIAPARVVLMSHDAARSAARIAQLQQALGFKVRHESPRNGLIDIPERNVPDLYVIDATEPGEESRALFALVSDLKTRTRTRLSAQLVIVPPGADDTAAMVLDLGADDVVFANTDGAEVALRLRNLIRQKCAQDRLRDRVRSGLRAAVTDPLTGLYNRRYAETHLRRMVDQARETGCEYALMMVDIDHFKAINDNHGHATGDRVLRELAQRLTGSFRDFDLVARVGGEEFLVAMPNTCTEAAEAAAQRLRRLVGSRPFKLGNGKPDLRVTISVGVAIDPLGAETGLSLSDMFAQADAALYKAKSLGRNAVSVSRTAA